MFHIRSERLAQLSAVLGAPSNCVLAVRPTWPTCSGLDASVAPPFSWRFQGGAALKIKVF